MNKHLITTLTLAAAALSTATAHAATGESWEVTTKTDMPGMPVAMGETTVTICLAKGAAKDPKQLVRQEEGCEMTDIKTSGSKTTWKMRCDRDGEVMTGTGEVTHKPDSYQGVTRLSGTSEGKKVDMTANYQGKRIGTPCDTSAGAVVAVKGMENVNEMMGMANKQMAAAMAEQCEISNYQTTELISNKFFGPNAACPGKEKFACKVINKDVKKDTQVFVKLAKHDDTSDVSIAGACGIDMPSTTKSICKKVDDHNYKELAEYCPVEAKAFETAETQRAYTSTPRSTSTVTDNPVNSAIDGAKKLKGLFGF